MTLHIDRRSVTKLEMLLAVAMSGYYQTTHVNYIPPGTTYRIMLMVLVTSKDIEPMGEHFYKLTKKGLKLSISAILNNIF